MDLLLTFIKKIWADIKDLVLDSLLCAFNKGEMSIEQKRGILSLVPKKDKDLRLLKNWRPISLLNTDFKIMTKVLAIRIQSVIGDLISPDQVAYIRGRYIGQNIRTITDVIDYCDTTENTGIIAFLDFEKAFDTLEWDFIDKTLIAFNFGDVFRDWIKVLYKNIQSCVVNNGFSSEFFTLSRGIRQGCPLSVYLFILAVELLAIELRTNKHINGIRVGQTEIKLIQMADDTTVFLSDAISLHRTLGILFLFSKAAGLKLNRVKTEALWVGVKQCHKRKPYGIVWKEDRVFSLGIWYCSDPRVADKLNFEARYDSMCKLLNMWSQRDLSLKGKITVIKSFALPKLLYVCSNLAVTEDFVKKVNSVFFKFVWSNKNDKIKRDTLIAPIESGGLKMIHFQTMVKSQKAMWVQRLLTKDCASWKAFPKWLCGDMKLEDFFKCSLDANNLPGNFPVFYHQIYYAWAEIQNVDIKEVWDIRRQFLWFNKNIMIGKNYAWNLYIEWYKAGIKLVHDIVMVSGNFRDKNELENKFNIKIDIMKYNSLKDAIPGAWRKQLKTQSVANNAISNEESCYVVLNNVQKPIEIICNKDLYWQLVKPILAEPICKAK